jgi:hypothetical protein
MTSPGAPAPSRNDSRNDTAVRCPACGQSFIPSGRRRWCSDACRQAAWRSRHQPAQPAGAAIAGQRPTTREATIYQCDECDERYIGDQWCHECNRPCRRIGPGGPCPHCDQPVAIKDLITVT